MNPETRLAKLGIHFSMEVQFPSESLQEVKSHIVNVDGALQETTDVLHALETNPGGATAVARAQELLDRYSGEQERVQQWCKEVLTGRFEQYVPIPHHVPIERLMPLQHVNAWEMRTRVANAYGFRFLGFSDLLNASGFWRGVGPLLQEMPEEIGGIATETIDWENVSFALDNPNFPALVNAVNGSSQIDYESAFPSKQWMFDIIKKHKFHLDDETVAQKKQTGRSPLSVSDILSTLVIDMLNDGLSDELKQQVFGQSAAVLDDSVSNTDRIQIYKALQAMYRSNPVDGDVARAAEHALDLLALPTGHEGRCESLETLEKEWDMVDAVVPVHSSDDGLNAYVARNVLKHYSHAFMIPSGGRSPHEVKVVGKGASQYTEADHMIAIALARNLEKIFPWQYPDLPKLSELQPLDIYDVLAPDEQSVDTRSNAGNTQARLEKLQGLLSGKKLSILLVTNRFHAPRAFADFRKAVPKHVVSGIKILAYNDSPHLTRIVEERKIHGLQYVIGEYLKQAYMVATDVA